MIRPDAFRHVVLLSVLTCIAVAAMVHATGFVLMTAGAITVTAALVFLRHTVRHWRLMRGLLAVTHAGELHGIGVRLGPVREAAFVAGLARPHIFCDAHLAATLSDEELRAVTFHEHAHQVAREPLRMALLAVIAPVVRHVASGAAWLEGQAAHREIAADRAALARGASRAALASALLKVGEFEPAGASGFTPAIDLRLRALLDDDLPDRRSRPWGATLAAIGLAATLCLLLLHGSSSGVMAFACC